MPHEWKTVSAGQADLAGQAGNLEAEGFEIFGIHPVGDPAQVRFTVIARRPLKEPARQRMIPVERVYLRTSRGEYVSVDASGAVSVASTMRTGTSLFKLLRLGPAYEDFVVFQAPSGLHVQAQEEGRKPLKCVGSAIGSWEMFALVPKGQHRFLLRFFRSGRHVRVDRASGNQLIADQEDPAKAEEFHLEAMDGAASSAEAVVLLW